MEAVEEFERYMNLSVVDKRNEILEQITSYLNATFPGIQLIYKEDEFIITGDKEQSEKCREVLNEMIKFSAEKVKKQINGLKL